MAISQKDYHGLTSSLVYDEFSNRFVIGLEIDGGFIPYAQVSYAKADKWYGNTVPAPAPSEPAPADPAASPVDLSAPPSA